MKRVHLWRVSAAGALIAAVLLLVASGGSSPRSAIAATPVASSGVLSSTWSFPGADLQNNRDAGGPINASNVSTLGVAWTDPISAVTEFGGYASTPVVSGGVVYTQDLESNVQAIDQQSGKVLWSTKYNSADIGPNGVTVAGGMVFGTTVDSAFALRASTGKQIWIKKLTRDGNEGIDMPPGYDDGTVYVSTVPGNGLKNFYAGSGQAILWALNATTGATDWKFDQVPANLWSSANTSINSGGGLWYPPTFDGHGNLYIGIANPAPFPGTAKYPWGSSRPGPNLYTDSIVKLDQKTGKLLWYYQLTPHDIHDWDLENSPILANSGGQQIVIDGGKAGILIAVNAQTGKLLWRLSVGVHNGRDNDGLTAERDPSALHIPEAVEPGDFGGIESQLASNGTTVYAAVNNLPITETGPAFADSKLSMPLTKGTGDLVAVDEATGKIEWDDKLPSSPYGGATLANNVVLTTTFNGTLYAFNAANGKELWHAALPSGTNAPVAVIGNTVLTAASFPGTSGPGLIIAYRLGATGKLPGPSGPTGPTGSTATATVSLHSSPYGNILVDSKGDTLYLWAKDTHDKSACSGACLAVWPFVIVPGKPTAGPGVYPKLLGTITEKGGNEVTYNGWPLYTFVSDTKPGVITGEGNTSFGAPWWLVSATGTAVTKKP